MASGKTHEKLNILFFIGLVYLGLAGILFSVYGWMGIVHALILGYGYWIGTYYMNPDLDIKSRPYRRWKWLRFIWIPYQKLGHRSIWTHGIIIGDIIRYVYFIGLVLLVYWGLALMLGTNITPKIDWTKGFVLEHKLYFMMFFAGNCLSSLAHIIADHSSTGLKKMFKF